MDGKEITSRRVKYVLAEIRCAIARAKLAMHDAEAVGLALSIGMITPEAAIQMLWDEGAVAYLDMFQTDQPAASADSQDVA